MHKLYVSVMVAASLLIGGELRSVAQAGVPAAASLTQVFDVTTVRPSDIGNDSMSIHWSETAFKATNITVGGLLENAFGIREDLTSGLPGWAKSAHYDIVAKATEMDAASLKKLPPEQQDAVQRAMMQRLVEERFHLKSHMEVKQQPVYDLVAAKGGIKFKEAAKIGAEGCKGWMSSSGSTATMECVPIDTLCHFLAFHVQRTVIDKTGLPATQGYNMKMQWRRQSDGALSDADLQLPTIFAAVQEQLGLRLEPAKGPVETLVIEQIEKPSEN